MPSQREIRRRIGSVAQHQADHAGDAVRRGVEAEARPGRRRSPPRPYGEKIDEVLADLAAVLGGEDHPLLAEREGGKRLLVLLTSDRGLAGPLNTNAIRFIAREITESNGRAGARDRRPQGPRRDAPGPRAHRRPLRRLRRPARLPRHHPASPGSSPTTSSSGKYARVDLVYPRFVSTLVQRPVLEQLLPVEPTEDTEGIPGNQFIFEPSPRRGPPAAPAAVRRDARLPGGARERRPASTPARWSR